MSTYSHALRKTQASNTRMVYTYPALFKSNFDPNVVTIVCSTADYELCLLHDDRAQLINAQLRPTMIKTLLSFVCATCIICYSWCITSIISMCEHEMCCTILQVWVNNTYLVPGVIRSTLWSTRPSSNKMGRKHWLTRVSGLSLLNILLYRCGCSRAACSYYWLIHVAGVVLRASCLRCTHVVSAAFLHWLAFCFRRLNRHQVHIFGGK